MRNFNRNLNIVAETTHSGGLSYRERTPWRIEEIHKAVGFSNTTNTVIMSESRFREVGEIKFGDYKPQHIIIRGKPKWDLFSGDRNGAMFVDTILEALKYSSYEIMVIGDHRLLTDLMENYLVDSIILYQIKRKDNASIKTNKNFPKIPDSVFCRYADYKVDTPKDCEYQITMVYYKRLKY